MRPKQEILTRPFLGKTLSDSHLGPGPVVFQSRSPSETIQIGRKIGRFLKAGDVVALSGDLGAGKTTLVKGIAGGLSVKDEKEVVSPSFVLIHEYQGREKIYHLDWYRLKSVRGFDESLAEECFNSSAVVLVEWAERGKRLLPKEHLWIQLKYKGPASRRIEVRAKGKKYEGFLVRLSKR